MSGGAHLTSPTPYTRPGTRVGSRGVVLCTLLVALLLSACSAGPVAVEVPEVPDDEATACRDLVAALPDEVDGEERREVTGADGRAAAWGDPAIVLRCGVPQPADFTDTASCLQANGTGWFIPDAVLASDDQTRDVTMTAVGFRPRVEVFLPGDYRPDGVANASARIGSVVADRLEEVQPCR